MNKSIPFKVLTCFLDKLRPHHLIALDQLQSEKYLNDCRKRLFTYCYWREIIGFQNYVTLELFKETEKPSPQEEKFIEYEISELYFNNNFVFPYNNAFTKLEYLTKIKPIIESITNELITNKDYCINESFESTSYLKNQQVTFLDFSDHTFSFRNIPSPLYRLSCQYNKVKKSISNAFKDDLHRFHQNVKVETNLKSSFDKEEADYILKNIDFYNNLFYYGRIIFLMPANGTLIENRYYQIIEDAYTYTKKLTFLSEDYTEIHRKRLKDSLYFYKKFVNETSEQKAYDLVKIGYQLSQCYIRLEIILIQLSFIRFLKFSLINCDPTLVKIGSLFDNLSGENKFVYFDNKKISLDSFNDFSHSSVKQNKQILETVLEEEKLRFNQLFNDLMNFTQLSNDLMP